MKFCKHQRFFTGISPFQPQHSGSYQECVKRIHTSACYCRCYGQSLIRLNYQIQLPSVLQREAAKKILMAGPLRGRGGKGRPLRKKNFCRNLKKKIPFKNKRLFFFKTAYGHITLKLVGRFLIWGRKTNFKIIRFRLFYEEEKILRSLSPRGVVKAIKRITFFCGFPKGTRQKMVSSGLSF